MLDFSRRKIDVVVMRRLMLLRHAKSDRSTPGARDRDRPLDARGKAAAPRIGAYMARHDLVPDRVLCSSARRTEDTWSLVAAAFAKPPMVEFDNRLYDASADTILDVVRKTGADIHSLLVIGHNPGLQDLAGLLIASGDVEARERLREKFPTAALLVIDFAFDDWRKLHRRAGRLDRFVTPRSLASATD
jgi:phosphohistidine phosphatase